MVAFRHDETLRAELRPKFVLDGFERDAGELLQIIEPGSRLAQMAEEEDLGPEPVASEAPVRPPMSAEDRQRRDFHIRAARLRGTPAKEVAETFGLTTRQVRRVCRAGRDSSYPGDREATENVTRGLAEMERYLDALGVLQEEAESPREVLKLAKQRASLVSQRGPILRDAGLISPETFVADWRVRSEWVRNANTEVRAYLESQGADEATIEGVVDRILEAAGMEEFSDGGGHRSGVDASA